MRWIVVLFMVLWSFVSATEIQNTTTKDMFCEAYVPAKYDMELIHGIKQRVQVRKEKYISKVIPPHKIFQVDFYGRVDCYNEDLEIVSYDKDSIQKIEGDSLKAFRNKHELFDITSYINEDKTYVEQKASSKLLCEPYGKFEYCRVTTGLDMMFDKQRRVVKLFLYDNVFGNYKHKAFFNKDALDYLRVLNKPLGLWVKRNNKKVTSSKPTIQTTNLIYWDKPLKGIDKVIFTPQNGHLQMQDRYTRSVVGSNFEIRDYIKAVEVVYHIDDKAYQKKKHQTSKHKAVQTWGQILNKEHKIPIGKFKAFYINTNNPKKVIASELVDKATINYVWDKFHGIKSQDFGAYWVGEFVFDKDEDRIISVSLSWAKVRIIIDGKVVYEGGNSKEMEYHFSKGQHLVEIEFVNNWHTTNFKCLIEPKVKKYTTQQIRDILKQTTSKKSEILYASVYGSKSKDQKITLSLKHIDKPIVLLLNSYDSVLWDIDNSANNKIEAIVLSSGRFGSEVSGDISHTPIYRKQGTIGSHSMQKKCICINGGALFNCSGSFGDDVIHSIEDSFDKKVYGFSVKHSSNALSVPETIITPDTIKMFEQNREYVKKAKKDCDQKSNPSFDKIFK